ncbi:uncharacterized protein [Procambarus clarkii]|uniref:uncharacterized protein n=1 Tax=Procambarus clarkii TaxID=6728 RepID=UPI003742B228
MKFQEVFAIERGEVPELGEVAVNLAALEGFEITRDEVKRHMLDLDLRKAVVSDGISPWVLKECADVLCLPLSVVYSRSLETGDLPEMCNTANVVPIYKMGDRQEALNYRPILEYAAPAWNPYLVNHKSKLEKFQSFATRLMPELRSMIYEERL